MKRNLIILIVMAIAVPALIIVTQGFAQPTDGARAESEDQNGQEDDGDNETEDESPIPAGEATLTEAEAIAIAVAERGTQSKRVELERERRRLVYSIEMVDGSEVEIDADTGTIIEVEPPGSDQD